MSDAEDEADDAREADRRVELALIAARAIRTAIVEASKQGYSSAELGQAFADLFDADGADDGGALVDLSDAIVIADRVGDLALDLADLSAADADRLVAVHVRATIVERARQWAAWLAKHPDPPGAAAAEAHRAEIATLCAEADALRDARRALRRLAL